MIMLNGKDSFWLQLEVCREYQRSRCTRSDVECKFAHPPTNVEIQSNGRVTACYDSIKGRCQRESCKYMHPPAHLKDQLLINGRNHLALKNALLQQQPAAAVAAAAAAAHQRHYQAAESHQHQHQHQQQQQQQAALFRSAVSAAAAAHQHHSGGSSANSSASSSQNGDHHLGHIQSRQANHVNLKPASSSSSSSSSSSNSSSNSNSNSNHNASALAGTPANHLKQPQAASFELATAAAMAPHPAAALAAAIAASSMNPFIGPGAFVANPYASQYATAAAIAAATAAAQQQVPRLPLGYGQHHHHHLSHTGHHHLLAVHKQPQHHDPRVPRPRPSVHQAAAAAAAAAAAVHPDQLAAYYMAAPAAMAAAAAAAQFGNYHQQPASSPEPPPPYSLAAGAGHAGLFGPQCVARRQPPRQSPLAQTPPSPSTGSGERADETKSCDRQAGGRPVAREANSSESPDGFRKRPSEQPSPRAGDQHYDQLEGPLLKRRHLDQEGVAAPTSGLVDTVTRSSSGISSNEDEAEQRSPAGSGLAKARDRSPESPAAGRQDHDSENPNTTSGLSAEGDNTRQPVEASDIGQLADSEATQLHQ